MLFRSVLASCREPQILPDPAQIVVLCDLWQQMKRVVKKLSVESCGEESCIPNTFATPAGVKCGCLQKKVPSQPCITPSCSGILFMYRIEWITLVVALKYCHTCPNQATRYCMAVQKKRSVTTTTQTAKKNLQIGRRDEGHFFCRGRFFFFLIAIWLFWRVIGASLKK